MAVLETPSPNLKSKQLHGVRYSGYIAFQSIFLFIMLLLMFKEDVEK